MIKVRYSYQVPLEDGGEETINTWRVYCDMCGNWDNIKAIGKRGQEYFCLFCGSILGYEWDLKDE